ncbi:hypothetical protein K504DRAFT_486611 [Pleomassaria siparia CBS 279.74]|uniref:Uncharacterized protein n=1 Tax=Pleomassaria siparia CBS 279.74 TaxID=1314801 RepID=A0A6G1KPL4_9PLEO|nr:hypothetical protein K504DRAFT_486611 [Pleomassaria siparia CBS 279.74]
MPLRIPPQVRQQLFSTSSRARTTMPANFHSYKPTPAQFPLHTTSAARLGSIGRWYLPTMALITVGMSYYLPTTLFPPIETPPGPRTVKLEAANRQIGFAVSNSLEEHNHKQHQEPSQEERNMMLLELYGERNSLEDMERALSGHGVVETRAVGQSERNKMMDEAYGERKSLKDLERALEVYEVQ